MQFLKSIKDRDIVEKYDFLEIKPYIMYTKYINYIITEQKVMTLLFMLDIRAAGTNSSQALKKNTSSD